MWNVELEFQPLHRLNEPRTSVLWENNSTPPRHIILCSVKTVILRVINSGVRNEFL